MPRRSSASGDTKLCGSQMPRSSLRLRRASASALDAPRRASVDPPRRRALSTGRAPIRPKYIHTLKQQREAREGRRLRRQDRGEPPPAWRRCARRSTVTVDLRMVGSPDHGVTLDFARWHGRTRRLDRYCSTGDLRLLGRFMYSLQGEPYSLGLFIPFEEAFKAVKEFIESDGELPTNIGWISGEGLPPVPTWPQQKLPG